MFWSMGGNLSISKKLTQIRDRKAPDHPHGDRTVDHFAVRQHSYPLKADLYISVEPQHRGFLYYRAKSQTLSAIISPL